MANCPKCRKKLKLWHVSQYCPYCGANVVFGSFESQFEKDRRIAEMSIGSFRVKLEKVKKAFISGLPQKLKIAACILPLASLFIPLGSFSVSTALYEKKLTFWALDMFYNAFLGEGTFNSLGLFVGSPVFGEAAEALRTAMLCYAAAAAAAVAILLTELFCFAGNKRTGITITAFSAVGAASIIAANIFCSSAVKCVSSSEIMNADSNILFIIPVLLFVFAAFSAVYALKNPPVYSFKEGDELRAEYYAKYKRGDIALSDIPAPISESAEEKAEREKLIKGAYQMEGDDETDG